MTKNIGLQLLAYSILLAGLSYFTYHLAPALARTTLSAGLTGGALCLIWALRAIAGSRGRALPLLTLIAVSFVLLSQTVLAWGAGTQETAGRTVAALNTVLCGLSVIMLVRIAYAGIFATPQTRTPPLRKTDSL